MSDKYKLLRNNINKVISEISKPIFSEVYNTINSEIESLCDNGIISFENDYSLTSFALECRTKEIFRNMKFDIIKEERVLKILSLPLTRNLILNSPSY